VVIDALASVLFGLLRPLIAVLPTGSLPMPEPDKFGALINAWDFYFPIKGPLMIVAAWVTALGAYLVLRVVMWLWRALPMT
jgi:hypothetical protein